MTTKTLRKLTTQATIAFTAMMFLGFAIYKEIKVLYTYVSKSQILQRQGLPSSEINGITLLWFAIFAATLYAILKCVGYLFSKIQKIRETKSVLAEREKQRKIGIEERKARRQKRIENGTQIIKELMRPLLYDYIVQSMKEKKRKVEPTEEQWKEIKEDLRVLSYEELTECLTSYGVPW